MSSNVPQYPEDTAVSTNFPSTLLSTVLSTDNPPLNVQSSSSPNSTNYLPTGQYNPKQHYIFTRVNEVDHKSGDNEGSPIPPPPSDGESSANSISSENRGFHNTHHRQNSQESNWNYLNYLSKGAQARTEDNEFNNSEANFSSLLDRFNFFHESMLAIHARLEAAYQQSNFYLQNTSEAMGKFFALLQVNQQGSSKPGSSPITISHPYANLSNLVALSHQKANDSKKLLELSEELTRNCLQKLESVTISHQSLFQRIDTRGTLRQALLHYQQKLENLKNQSNSNKYRRNVKKYQSSEAVFTAFNAALIGDLTAAWSGRMLVLGPAFNCWVKVEKQLNQLFAATLPNVEAIDEQSEDIQRQLQMNQQQTLFNSLIAKEENQPVRLYSSPKGENSAPARPRSLSQPDLLRVMSATAASKINSPTNNTQLENPMLYNTYNQRRGSASDAESLRLASRGHRNLQQEGPEIQATIISRAENKLDNPVLHQETRSSNVALLDGNSNSTGSTAVLYPRGGLHDQLNNTESTCTVSLSTADDSVNPSKEQNWAKTGTAEVSERATPVTRKTILFETTPLADVNGKNAIQEGAEGDKELGERNAAVFGSKLGELAAQTEDVQEI
jgi:hypothetical protein